MIDIIKNIDLYRMQDKVIVLKLFIDYTYYSRIHYEKNNIIYFTTNFCRTFFSGVPSKLHDGMGKITARIFKEKSTPAAGYGS